MTSNRLGKKAVLTMAFALATTAVVASGCSDDNNTKPEKTPIFGTGGSGDEDGGGSGGGSNGGKSSVGGKSNGGGTAAGGKGTSDIDGGDASASGGSSGDNDGGTGGADAGACTLPPGDHECYPCDPVTNEQFLNHCGGGTCYPFPNAQKLGANWNDGKLIDLP